MLPTRDFEKLIQDAPPDFRDIVLELRDIIFSIAPTATERAHWGGFGYFHAERGGPITAGICEITLLPDHVRLSFIHGAFLPDPHKLLEGQRKALRFIRLQSFETTPWEDLKDILTASSSFDPRTLPQNSTPNQNGKNKSPRKT